MKNTGRNLSQSTFISRIINSDIGRAQGHCLHYCHSSEMDRGIDDFVDPCSTELWSGSLFNSLSITILFIISLVR